MSDCDPRVKNASNVVRCGRPKCTTTGICKGRSPHFGVQQHPPNTTCLCLDNLKDVNAPNPTDGNYLCFTGGNWIDVQLEECATGPQGFMGVQGATGPQGLQGPQGATGGCVQTETPSPSGGEFSMFIASSEPNDTIILAISQSGDGVVYAGSINSGSVTITSMGATVYDVYAMAPGKTLSDKVSETVNPGSA